MTGFTAIADDLTGACDVGAELAAAGWRVRVAVDPSGMSACDDDGNAPDASGFAIPTHK